MQEAVSTHGGLQPSHGALEREHAALTRETALYIPSLDGIRALSFLIVFLSHAGLGAIIPGGFGVTVFFFLSGYLITTLLRLEYNRHAAVSLKKFYLRRVLRIFPPYYLVLFVASVLAAAGITRGSLDSSAVLSQAFFLSNYHIIFRPGYEGMAPGTGVYWSLAIEEHFYLFFPLLYILLRRYRPSETQQWLVLAGLCLAVLVWRFVLVYQLDSSYNRTNIATDTRIDSILFGCMLAIRGNPMLDPSPSKQRWRHLALALVGLAAIGVTMVARDLQFRETLRYSIQGIALTPLFVVAVRYPHWPVVNLLNLRWVRYLGRVSYSAYLVHQVVIAAVEMWAPWPTLVRAAVALVLSIAVAAAIYYAIEKPSSRLRRRISQSD